MTKTGVMLTVVGNDDLQSICSEIKLFTTSSETLSNSSNIVVILGLPVEITNEEFDQFIEPFLPRIDGFVILLEIVNPLVYSYGDSSGQEHQQQFKKIVILSFESNETKCEFISLYNNMQVSAFSEVAPCLVVAVDHLEVIYSGASETSSKGTSLFKNRALDIMTAANQFTSSQCEEPSASLLAQLLHTSPTLTSRRECNATGWKTPYNVSPANGRAATNTSPSFSTVNTVNSNSNSSKLSVNNAPLALVDAHLIPTCVVCLRRLLTAGRVITGAGDLRICRSYIYDNNVATVQRMEDSGALHFASKSPLKITQSSPHGSSKRTDRAMSFDATGRSDCLRCIVCHVYNTISEVKYSAHGNSSTSSSGGNTQTASGKVSSATDISRPPGSYCLDCGLKDNIWLCMLCSYTGCGRYKAQHAQQHYLSSGHTLSLELVSGRIWDYHSDTFAHIDDSAALQHREYSREEEDLFDLMHESGVEEDQFRLHNTVSTTDSDVLAGTSSPKPKASNSANNNSNVSFLVGVTDNHNIGHSLTRTFSKDKQPTQYLQGADASDASRLLDSGTVDKMEGLMRHYEDLLRAQLGDQQLHYEKLLARETVRALEATYRRDNNLNAINTSNGANKHKSSGNKATKSNPIKSNKNQSGVEHRDQSEDTAPPICSADTNTDEVDMSDIEAAKMEISLLEAQQRAVLDQIKNVEDETRALRRQNDVLVKNQKALREREADFLLKEEACRQRCVATVAEMEQQIRDLAFYTRTRKEMQVSPFKEEMREATVVTRQNSTSSTEDVSSRNSSSNNNDKTEKKGYRKYKK